LLLNFIHKHHQPISLPWKTWFLSHRGRDLGELSIAPPSWSGLWEKAFPYTAPSPV
jgi:hypothetical protein